MPVKKLKLDELSVDSFVTRISDQEQVELNGGTTLTCVGTTLACTTIIPIQVVTKTIAGNNTTTKANISPCPATKFQTKAGHRSCAGGQAC